MPASYPDLRRNNSFGNQPPRASLLDRVLAGLPSGIAAEMQSLFNRQSQSAVSTQNASPLPRALRQAQRSWLPRRLLSLPHLLAGIWVLVLLWGERWVFQGSVDLCEWKNWERWPKDATPHHLVFLADPQLIDPHSYPGRPWPLSSLTMMHTDNYLRRSYISMQKKLHPDTVFFLGDLFDGGREWKTAHGNTPDPSWANGQRPSGEQKYVETWGKRYGEDFWLKEYDRFGRIFYKYWNAGGDAAGPWQRGRRVISSLPGNHDLGFGANVKVLIRNRFEVYFGEGNRVDVVGNHTFVSVDSVSLSAGAAPQDTLEITKPVDEFLSNIQATKRKAVARELSLQAGEERAIHHPHAVEDLWKANFKNLPTLDPGSGAADLPTILLTHVPLYRNPGTPCGPKREHWPPSTPPQGQTGPVVPDDRNAISISKGWQYQNVLSEEDSVKLISKIGNVVSVFSGDDHDYCELVHPENKNNAREITVKSMSWAMGVRRPGFVMLSMWNPIGPDGRPLHSTSSGHGAATQKATTMESHLCLLPDQLGIFIRYGTLLAITLLILIGRAVLVPIFNLEPFSSSLSEAQDYSLLPTTAKDLRRPTEEYELNDHHTNSSTSSTSSNNAANLAPRSSAARTRSVSPTKGYGLPSSQSRYATPPLINQAGYYGNNTGNGHENGNGNGNGYGYGYQAKKWTKDGDEPFQRRAAYVPQKIRRDTIVMKVWREAWQSIWRAAWLVGIVFLYLTWYG